MLAAQLLKEALVKDPSAASGAATSTVSQEEPQVSTLRRPPAGAQAGTDRTTTAWGDVAEKETPPQEPDMPRLLLVEPCTMPERGAAAV